MAVVPQLFRVATHYLCPQFMATHLTSLGKNINEKTIFFRNYIFNKVFERDEPIFIKEYETQIK